MLARDIGSRHVITAQASDSLRKAGEIMHRHQVGSVVVVDSDGHRWPVGMVSDSELAMAVLVDKHDPDVATLAQVMRKMPPVVCHEDSSLTDLVAIMRGAGLRRLPVLDGDGAVIGIVTADDVIAALAEVMEDLASALLVDPALDHRCEA